MAMSLQPLLSRDRYTDAEWALASAGFCSWNTANHTRHLEYCERPSDPNSAYRFCVEHDRDIREDYPQHEYGR